MDFARKSGFGIVGLIFIMIGAVRMGRGGEGGMTWVAIGLSLIVLNVVRQRNNGDGSDAR